MEVNYRNESKYKISKIELLERILSKDEGTTITYKEIGEILKLNIYDELELHKLKSIMGNLKNILIDKGCVLKTIIGVGYYILKQNQISGYCYHTYIRKTTNLLQKSGRILSNVKYKELSEIRKEEYDNVCDLNIDMLNMTNNTIENSKYYDKKAYYDNLED